MIGTHPVAHSFSIGRDTLGYPLVFKLSGNCRDIYMIVFNWSCHTQFHTCFQLVGKHAVIHSLSNGWDTLGYTVVFNWSMRHPVTQSFSNCRATPSFKLVFKWSVDIRLNIRFQSVRTHGYILVFKWFDHTRLHKRFQMIGTHPVKHSFSFSRDTASSRLVFQIVDTNPLTHSISNCRETRGYTLVSR